PGVGVERRAFQHFLQGVSPVILAFWMLGTAATAAGSISAEREDDTWISLLSAPLNGSEIVRAKMWGAIVRFRWLGFVLIAVWTIALAVGALHPLGYALAVLETALFLAFAAALGVRISLRSPTTSRALGATVAWLLILNVGYFL